MSDLERIYEAAEVADILRCDVGDIRRWLIRGRFPGAFRVPNRQSDVTGKTSWRIPRSAYLAFLEWAQGETMAKSDL